MPALVWKLLRHAGAENTRNKNLLEVSTNAVAIQTPEPDPAPDNARPALIGNGLLERITSLESENRRLDVENKQLELTIRELTRLVYLDALTGLGNRRYFGSALEKAVAHAARSSCGLALLLCDIDFFKHCNDAYGHAHGDTVLVQIAALLQRSLRGEGCLARYGGEEFAVLLPGVGPKGAVLAAERLRKAVEALNIAGPSPNQCSGVTISIGVATLPPRGPLIGRRLVEAADAGLYRAKRAGRNRIKYQRVAVRQGAGLA